MARPPAADGAGTGKSPPRQLSMSKEGLQAALDALPDAVIVFSILQDANGDAVDLEYRLVNEAALRLFARSADEIVGHRHTELFHSVRDRGLWAHYQHLIHSDEPLLVSLPWFDENGIQGNFDVSSAPFEDGLLVTVRDVSERARTDAQLRHERDFNAAIVDVAGALVFVLDAEGRIVRVNRQFEAVSGYREAEVVGRHFEFLSPPPERPQVLDAWKRVLQLDHPVTYVTHGLTKEGALRIVRWSYAAMVGTDRQLTNVVVVGIDITEQEALAALLTQRNQELQAANLDLARSNEDLEQFAYLASHDLSEPLRAISGPLKYVAERYQHMPLDETANEMIAYATEGAARMRRLVDALLAFSRVGRDEEIVTAVDSGRVVTDVLANLSPVVRAARAEIHVDEDLPIVSAEPVQLEMVFQNLISNALKFMPTGIVPSISVTAERQGDAWRFSVTDNGIGIPEWQRERVFAMFRRLHPHDRYPGSGIGLALVRKIVERQGGQVGVDRAPTGSGSRFWFTLPAAAP